MKKTLIKTTIMAIILVVAILGTTVKAGSVTAPQTVKAGADVTVNINVDTAMENADITMKYDATKLTYKTASAGSNMLVQVNSDEAGVLIISVAGGDNTTKTVSITFTAKQDIKGNAGVEVTSFEANTNETLANTTVTIKGPETTNTPTSGNNKPAGNNQSTTGDKVGTDGKPITKLPQTGAPIFAGAVALVILTAGAIVLVKRTK